MVVKDKELLARVFHYMLSKMVDQKGDVDGLPIFVPARKFERVVTLVREEHLQATALLGMKSARNL